MHCQPQISHPTLERVWYRNSLNTNSNQFIQLGRVQWKIPQRQDAMAQADNAIAARDPPLPPSQRSREPQGTTRAATLPCDALLSTQATDAASGTYQLWSLRLPTPIATSDAYRPDRTATPGRLAHATVGLTLTRKTLACRSLEWLYSLKDEQSHVFRLTGAVAPLGELCHHFLYAVIRWLRSSGNDLEESRAIRAHNLPASDGGRDRHPKPAGEELQGPG